MFLGGIEWKYCSEIGLFGIFVLKFVVFRHSNQMILIFLDIQLLVRNEML